MPIYTPSKDIIAGSNISVSQTSTTATVAVTNVGSPNGIASLDGAGKVPVSQLPSSIMEYKGVWNASTNSPTLADGTGDSGDVYRVSVGGTQNLGSGSITFDVGDYVIYNGTIWQKSDTTDAVSSVNSLTGAVVLTTANISDSTNRRYVTDAQQTVISNTSGTNTGDQNLFSTVAVAGQSNVVADSTSDTLTLAAGTGVSITTDVATDTVTISSSAVVPANVADGRISISSTVSLPQGGSAVTHADFTPDVDADNTSGIIYYTPYTGNRISLFDNGAWRLFAFDANSSFSLTNLGANRLFDMFAFNNSGTVALEVLDWGVNTEYNITAVTVGANTVITFTVPAGTQPFAVGNVVDIQGVAGTSSTLLNNSWAVAAVGGTGTSRTVTLNSVNTTGLTYTGLGTIRLQNNSRTTGLASQDGVYVKSGDPTRKYLGTFKTTGAGQLTADNRAARLIWNFYNRRPRSLLRQEPTNSWTYGSTTPAWRAANNDARNRVEFVCGVAEDPIRFESAGCFRGPAPALPPTEPQFTVISSYVLFGIGINNSLTSNMTSDGIGYLAQLTQDAYAAPFAPGYSTMQRSFAGYNFATFVENAYTNRAGTVCTIASFATGVRAAGITGTMWG